MKPHLPLALLSALFAAFPLVETLRAETLFATGASVEQLTASSRFSDTGKGCYFSESYNYYQPYKGAEELYKETGNWNFMGPQLAASVNAGSSSVSGALGGLTHDVSMCWANATANVMQYWESYYGIFYDGSNGDMPYGWNYDPSLAETLGGSQSLTIYNEFYRHWYDEGGTFKWASDWYCRRVDPSKSYIRDEGTGGWWENWFGESHAYSISYYDGNSNIDALTRQFAAALGYTAQEDGAWVQTTVGQIGYLGISSYLGGHALTCWGMELGEDNRVKAIYIANSDDLTYQLVKLYIKSVDGQYYLFSDEECSEYWNWNAANWYLDEVSYLNTPQALKDLYREYSSATLTWTGVTDEWSEAVSADRRIGYELPGSNAGWSLTVQDKRYDSYFDTNRNVHFDDTAAVTDIRTGGHLAAASLVLENSKKTYTFTAGADGCRLTADSLTATTQGSAVFNGMDVAAGTLLSDGYNLTVQNGTLGAQTATLQGGASLTLGNSTAVFGDLSLGNGTVLTLDLSRAGDETAIISVSGNMVTAGGLTLNVNNLPTDLSELYMVICAGSYDTSLWNSQTVTLNGAAADQLFWRDGVLYYGSYVDKQHLYFTAHTEAPEKWRKFEGLSFTDISYQGGGAALENRVTLRLEKNGPVLWENNRATGSGGAVLNSGTLVAEGNKSLTFRGNQATEKGGALANVGGSISITGSQAVTFEKNAALAGGALSQSGGSTVVSGNGSVLFCHNGAAESGGAAVNEGGTLQFTDNGTLSFAENHADGNGGALSNADGQILIDGSASFTDNRAGGLGGAVYNAGEGRVIMKADAGDIVFRGNTQGSGSNTVLRAIHSQGDLHSDNLKENISAAEGHSVVFYDSVRVENPAWYGQTNLNTEGSGSIVFSGRYAAEDLQRLTGSTPGAAALRDSRASVFTGSIYLAGGTLRIEDGASVTTGALYTADGAVPVTIALADGALHTPNSSLTFGTNKTLELSGVNTVESSYVAFFSESTLTFNLSAVHADTAALTVLSPDRLDMQGSLTLNLNGTETVESGRYKLIETAHGALWDGSLTINGGYAEALTWENGTLWYDTSYEPIPVPSTDLVFTESLFGSFNYSGNDSLTFTTGINRAIDETGCDPAEAVLAENGSLSFLDIKADAGGGAIVNVSAAAASPSVIVLSGNGPVEFSNISAAGDGGIISNTALNGGEARIDILGNGTVQLLGGCATEGRGGALFNAGQVSILQNGEISLGDNVADKDGGAVYNAADSMLSFTENEGLNLNRNRTEGRGGAVANYGELHLDGNNFVVATGNSSLYGAALYNEGQLSMEGNCYIQFAGNDCVKHGDGYSDFGMGGNICNSEEGTVSIRDNGNVSLSSTYALYGGGIYNEGSIVIENNRDVNLDSNSTEGNGGALFNMGGSFVLNHNRNVTFNEDWAWSGYGGAVCNMAGTVDINANESLSVYSSYCALSNGNTSSADQAVMNIIGNGDIVFYDNIAYQTKDRFKGKAGAVYNHANGTLNICGNEYVEFANNTVLQFAEVSPTGKDRSYLHALHNEGTLNLSAAAGKSIIFFDGMDSAKGSVVNLNAAYTDADGKTQQGAGDIVFSGLRAESILRGNMLAEFVTPELIALSKTSTFETEVNLYGGRLVAEADARLIADALTAHAGTVRVAASSLAVKGALTLHSGSVLEAAGVNSISASSVVLLAGSTLSLDVGKQNLTSAVLTLSGTLTTESLSLALAGVESLEKGNSYALLSVSDYKTSAWTSDAVTVTTGGIAFEDLSWKDGTLYLNYGTPHPLTKATWSNAAGDGLWNTDSENWKQAGEVYAYADGVEVVFGDIAAGTVTLVGDLAPKSVRVDSAEKYTFDGKGKLTGATSLTKAGTGTLTIKTANDYTGGTTVNGGTLAVADAAALGTGVVFLNGGTLEIAANGFANEIVFAGDTSLIVDAGYELAFNKRIDNYHNLTLSGTIVFKNIDGGAIFNDGSNATFTLRGNGKLAFIWNTTSAPGGAIYSCSAFTLDGNGDVSFIGNTAAFSCGGAIRNDSTFTLSKNSAVTFSENTAWSNDAASLVTGGAIYNKSTFELSDNGDVVISGNTAAYRGGAIDNYGSDATVTMSGNGDVLFSGNTASNFGGGAIYNYGSDATFTLCGNGDVSFMENTSSASGGAICNWGTFAMSSNEDVTFIGNTCASSGGGAIFSCSSFMLSGNGNVIFRENTASSSGGAIYNYGREATFMLCGNGDVTFSGNTASHGGAIYNRGTFTLSGNGDVLFEKNAEIKENVYCLRSIDSTAILNLSAAERKRILFKDSICASGIVNLNQEGTGDIIFTGVATEVDLREIKGGINGTESEILNSRTSEISTMTNLYGGRLIVEDGAILKGKGITVASDSGATVRVKDATMNHSGYALTFNDATTLEVQGESSIAASSLLMKEGSKLAFSVENANRTTPALTLTGSLTTETISVAFNGLDSLESGRYAYALMTVSSYDSTLWTSDKITVVTEGVSFEDLSWRDGTLYLNYGTPHPLTKATWSNAAGDGLWNTDSENWRQVDEVYAYADGVEVVFGDIAAGTVTLVGDLAPKSVRVDSAEKYTFDGKGKLTGATSLTKAGTGTLTIKTANDYTGGTTVNGGTLAVANAAALGTGVVFLNGGTLEIAANGFANEITAAGNSVLTVAKGCQLSLNKALANSGTLTMVGSFDASSLTLNTTAATHIDVNGNSGASGFAKDAAYSVQLVNGGSVVNNGATVTHGSHNLTLGNDGYATAGGVIHNDTYLLTGTDAVTTSAVHQMSSKAAVSMNGGSLTVDDAAVVTAVGGSLTLDGGSLTGTVQTTAGSALTLRSSASLIGDLILDGGALALNGKTLMLTGELNLLSETALDVSSYGIGEYQLLTFGELTGSLDNLNMDSKRYRYALSQVDNTLMLTVKALNNTLTWEAPKGVWSTNGIFGSGLFREDDAVVFCTAATVTISGEVKPESVLVDSAAKVTFTNNKKELGSGIAGEASLTKNGAGILMLNAGNSYSGGTVLNAGTIKATAADSFGWGIITVNGGTLDLAGKAVANDMVLAGAVTLKGDAKYTGAVTVEGNATLLAKTSYKGMTTVGEGNSLTLAEKATMAGSLTVDGGTVNGLLTVGAGSTLVWKSGTFATAPVLKGGTLDLGGYSYSWPITNSGTNGGFVLNRRQLTLSGNKAQIQFGDKSVNLLGKGVVRTDDELTVNGGTVTVNALKLYERDINVNSGTLKLATGKEMTSNTIRVNGCAAVVNGAAHYGNIVVDGTLDKGTTIKLLKRNQIVELNGEGTLLGTISGAGNVDVRASIDATAAKLTAANINLYDGTFTNTKGIKLAKGQTLTLAGASLNLGLKGALATAAGTTLVVGSNTHVEGSLTLGGGTLIFDGGSSLEVSGTLTLSKAMGVYGSGVITYTTLKAAKNADVELLFGKGTILDEAKHTLTFGGARMVACVDPEMEIMSLVAAAEEPIEEEPEAETTTAPALVQTPATPSPEMLRPAGDAMVMADWAILDANRAFVNTLQGRRDSGVLLADGQGVAWASAMGGVSRHGSENGHNGADVNLSGAAVGVEHTAGANSMLGLAVGHTWGRIGATGVQNLRQDTAHVALYGQTKLPHGFTADWSAAYGDTSSKGTFYGSRETWSQRSTALSARVSKAQSLNDTTAVRGFAGLNYDATDAGTLETVHTGSVQRLQGEVGAGITHRADKLTTYAEISLTADIDRHTPSVDFGTFRQGGANPGRTGLNLTLGAAYELNDKWSVNASYHVETAARNTQHSLNVGAGRKF